MSPSYSDIRYFLELGKTLNMSRAAERLGISQPSLSLAVKRLEGLIGSSLLIRGKSGVQLTKSGTTLVRKGRLLLLNWDQLKAEVNKAEEEVSGNYVLGCHTSVGLYTLEHFLPKLVNKHSDLELKLVHDISRKITEGVISFEIDFGIVVNPIRHPDLVIKSLCYDEVFFWVSAEKSSLTQSLNMKEGVLICDLNLNQSQTMLADLKKQKQGFRRMIESPSLEVIADLTLAGAGVGLLPRRVALKQGKGRLKLLDKNLPSFRDHICLIYRADSQKTKASKAIIEAISKTKSLLSS